MTAVPARSVRVGVPVLVGALISVGLGVYGNYHQGKSIVFQVTGFHELIRVKSWLAVVVLAAVLVQVGSALVMYGRIRFVTAPPWIGVLHRWSGRLAFFVAVPVGVFCLYGIGFQHYDTRVLVHSLLGCLFFGVFTCKMLLLTKRGLAGWVLPVAGGLVFTALAGVVLTSAGWYFTLR